MEGSFTGSGSVILTGRYAVTDEELETDITISGEDSKRFYDSDKQLIKVRTEIGDLWVPLYKTGVIKNMFNPHNEIVLVFLADRDYIISNVIEDGSVVRSDMGFAVIVNTPPQAGIVTILKRILSNTPTKLFDSSDSNIKGGYEINVDGTGIKVGEGIVQMSSDGSNVRLGKDGIVQRGKVTTFDFFNSSKAGVLKENWIGNLIPQTIFTPNPTYLPDQNMVTLISKIKGAVDAFKGIK
jgi:hypothetical protein